MRTATITAEQVADACAAIAADGQEPTLRAVRDALGTGSLTTIAPLLRAWKEQEAKAHAAPPPTPLTEAARSALERLGAEMWALAERQAAERLEAERAETERVRAELGAERDEALQAADEAATDREKAEEAAKTAQEAREQALMQLAAARAEKEALQRQLGALQEEHKTLQARFEDALQRAAAAEGTKTALEAPEPKRKGGRGRKAEKSPQSAE